MPKSLSPARRVLIIACGDSLAWAVGLAVGLLVRFDGVNSLWDPFFPARYLVAVALAAVAAFVAAVLGGRWFGWIRYGTFNEVVRLGIVTALTTGLLMVLNLVVEGRLLPFSVVVGGAACAFVLSLLERLFVRLLRESKRHGGLGAKAVVFGAGEGGEQTVWAMRNNPESPYRPVALLDDDPKKLGMRIANVRVLGGRHVLVEVARRCGASVLVIAIPGARSDLIRELAAAGTEAGLDVRVLPPVGELFGPAIDIADIRELTDEDLLGRESVRVDLDEVGSYLRGRRVLVTGAGGSIGSEISRQVRALDPAALILLDRDESAIHALQLELEGRAMLDSRALVIADIRDRARMLEVFMEHRPEIVFHAAALKHLPLLEMYPGEALKSNVLGTANVVDAAAAGRVQRFVNISTDKAADPCSILGFTKRLAEGITAAAGEDHPGTFISVRFGNVLGSRGSVLTSFRSQIDRGGPVTVTDPEVTRFFMTVSEAVHLVIEAGAIGADGEVLVLDMGDPVRIADVARQLVAQAHRPIEIVYTGLRPGEKLHEVLIATGEIDDRPHHDRLSHVTVPPLARSCVRQLAGTDGDPAIAAALAELCVTEMSRDRSGSP